MAMLWVLAFPANAQDIPELNIEAECREADDIFDTDLFDSCMKYQQSLHQQLRDGWGEIDPAILDHCVSGIERENFNSYELLLGCIEIGQESRSK